MFEANNERIGYYDLSHLIHHGEIFAIACSYVVFCSSAGNSFAKGHA